MNNYTRLLYTLSAHLDAMNNPQPWQSLAPVYMDMSDFMTASMYIESAADDFSKDSVDLSAYRNMEALCGDAGTTCYSK
jgi:hypothetical protein